MRTRSGNVKGCSHRRDGMCNDVRSVDVGAPLSPRHLTGGSLSAGFGDDHSWKQARSSFGFVKG